MISRGELLHEKFLSSHTNGHQMNTLFEVEKINQCSCISSVSAEKLIGQLFLSRLIADATAASKNGVP